MAFGRFEGRTGRVLMHEMNMIPLIDVMLVLLVIFIVTAPVLTNALKVDLPEAQTQTVITQTEKIHLSIKESGETYYDGVLVDRQTAQAWLASAA